MDLDLKFDQPIAEQALDSNTGKIVVKLGPRRTGFAVRKSVEHTWRTQQ
jgi:hypothetical protein